MKAYILVQARVGKAGQVVDEISHVPGIISA